MTIQIHDLPEPEELTSEQAAAIYGGKAGRNQQVAVGYEVVLRRLKGQRRFIQNKITRKNVVRLTRLKQGKYEVRYRALVTSQKRTSSGTNFSPANRFNFG